MPESIRAVIFDMDGLLLDTERVSRSIWQQAAREYGREISDELFVQFVGRTGAASEALLKSLWGADFDYPPFRQRLVAFWQEHLVVNAIVRKKGVVPLLEFLRSKEIPCAVATSTYKQSALEKLGDLAIYFRSVTTGDEVANSKPAPDIFLLAAQRLAVLPPQCVVLEDSLAGIDGATAAGMYPIMVPDLVPPHENIAHVCESLHHALDWLRTRL